MQKVFSAILSIFVTLFSFANFSVAFAAGSVAISGQPASISTSAGNTFTVNININTNGDSVSAAELHISYDPSFLEGQSITAGSILPVVLLPGTISAGTAAITLGSQPTSPITGSGILATLTFKALKSGSTNISINNTTQTASIGKTGNTAGSLSGVSVSIGGGSTIAPSPTPVSTSNPTSTLVEAEKLGLLSNSNAIQTFLDTTASGGQGLVFGQTPHLPLQM